MGVRVAVGWEKRGGEMWKGGGEQKTQAGQKDRQRVQPKGMGDTGKISGRGGGELQPSHHPPVKARARERAETTGEKPEKIDGGRDTEST